MAFQPPSLTTLTAAAALISLILCLSAVLINKTHLPPGPYGLPLLGNVDVLSQRNNWFQFSKWSKEYGDIFRLRIFNKNIIILNNFHLAQDLLEKHGSNFSDRPRMVVISELFKVISVTFLPYGDRWREHRRIMHKYFNSKSVTAFQAQQTKQARLLLHDLQHSPNEFQKHVQKFATATIVGLTYGRGIMANEKYMDAVDSATSLFNVAGSPGISLLDLFPPLRFFPSSFPGCRVKKNESRIRTILRDMTDHPFQTVVQQRDAGTAPPSLVSRMLTDYEQARVTDLQHVQVMKEVAASLYRAGAATTHVALRTFFLLISFHPHVAKRAQQELDELLGGERLPEYSDRSNLPYVDCILKEVLRWNPPLPLGIPHRNLSSTLTTPSPSQSHQYHIPAGSTIVANIWHIAHDPHTYADPSAFDPDRFLRDETCLDPMNVVFGFGRRICPGRHFASASLFLAIAHILTVYDVLTPLDKDGKPLELDLRYARGFDVESVPCRIVPRSGKAARLVEEDKTSQVEGWEG